MMQSDMNTNDNNSMVVPLFLVMQQEDEDFPVEDLLFQYLRPDLVPPPTNVPEHEYDTTALVQSPVSLHDPITPIGTPTSPIHYFSQLQLMEQPEQQQYDIFSPIKDEITPTTTSITTTTTTTTTESLPLLQEEELSHDRIQLQITSFSDLQTALRDIGQDSTSGHNASFSSSPMIAQQHYQFDQQHRRRHSYFTAPQATITQGMETHSSLSIRNEEQQQETITTEEDLIHLTSADFHVPNSIRLNVQSSQMLDSLMEQAITHWCCIGFKVAPISLDLIRNWHQAPPAIVYCVASISLVTFMDHHASQSYIKEAAIAFYEQARHKMDDVFVEDMQPMVIQAYFCLSYTSNLLRLYEQQRTWGGLASIALQQHAKEIAAGRPVDRLTMMCWLRWYYVDAWMCLTLNRECLLADNIPLHLASLAQQDSEEEEMSHAQQQVFYGLYQFAALTQYMRMYIRAIRSGAIFKSGITSCPSAFYRNITEQLKQWYAQQRQDQQTEIHFHLCYHATRLVILFQFLHPTECPPHDILIDCLETNLALLQALQYLKEVGCDQSTYHHMFFAIHNTAKRIFMYNRIDDIQSQQQQLQLQHHLNRFAEEQLRINLKLLRGTQAYINDVFKVRLYAEKIEQQFRDLRITVGEDENTASPLSSSGDVYHNLTFNNDSSPIQHHHHHHHRHGSSITTATAFSSSFFSSSPNHPHHHTNNSQISSSSSNNDTSSPSSPSRTSFHPNNNNDNGAHRIFVFRQKPIKTPNPSRMRKKASSSSSSSYDKIKKENLKRQFSVTTTTKVSCSSTTKKKSTTTPSSTTTIFQQQQCH